MLFWFRGFRYAGRNDAKARLFDMSFEQFLQVLANLRIQWTVVFLCLLCLGSWSVVSDRSSLEKWLGDSARIFRPNMAPLAITGYFRPSTAALNRDAKKKPIPRVTV
jgi:hypothetical protein